LPCATFPENRHDLRDFARHAQHARAGLQVLQRAHGRDTLIVQRVPRREQPRDKRHGRRSLATKPQHQHADRHVLDRDQRDLAVRREGEAIADVVREADGVAGRFQQVGEEADARGGVGVQEFEELGDFDDGGGGDDAEAEGFGDGEFGAGWVGEEVQVVDERGVAGVAQEVGAEVLEGLGEVVGDGLEEGAERIFEGVHGCVAVVVVVLFVLVMCTAVVVLRRACESRDRRHLLTVHVSSTTPVRVDYLLPHLAILSTSTCPVLTSSILVEAKQMQAEITVLAAHGSPRL